MYFRQDKRHQEAMDYREEMDSQEGMDCQETMEGQEAMDCQEGMDCQGGMDCTEAMEHKEAMEHQEAMECQDVQDCQEVPLFIVSLLSVLLPHRYRFVQVHMLLKKESLIRFISAPCGKFREHSVQETDQLSKNHCRLHSLTWRLIWACLITTSIQHILSSLSALSLCSIVS
jgi:hypothetical protein